MANMTRPNEKSVCECTGPQHFAECYRANTKDKPASAIEDARLLSLVRRLAADEATTVDPELARLAYTRGLVLLIDDRVVLSELGRKVADLLTA